MVSSKTSLLDRRREPRLGRPRDAIVRARIDSVEEREIAVLEDASEGGIRIRTPAPLRRGVGVSVFVTGMRKPVEARVIWCDDGGLMAREATHGLDRAWVAGCAVLPDSRKRLRAILVPEPEPSGLPVASGLVAAGIVGLLILLAYAFLGFVRLVGQATTSPWIPQ